MANDLKRPSAPHRISELSYHEWFRGTRDGEPIIAMKVGTYPNNTLVIVPKDGPVTSLYYGAAGDPTGFRFIDYLLDDEFVTIFGGAKERSDEADLGPLPSEFGHHIHIEDPQDVANIPNYTPYLQKFSHETYVTLNIPSTMRCSTNGKIGLCLKQKTFEADGYSALTRAGKGHGFQGYIDVPLSHWSNHPFLKDLAGDRASCPIP